MKRLMLSALAAGLALAPSIAAAHWEYSQWGMTPAQVIAASKGKATAQPRDYGEDIGPQAFLARADHVMNGQAFDVRFYFKQDVLSLVRLSLKDPAGCDRLEADLVKRYGPKSPSGSYFWIDAKTKDIVQFTDDRRYRDSCRVMYSKG